jgi:hypothetical protein
MGYRLISLALRHRLAVTALLLTGLLVNLVVIGTTEGSRAQQRGDLPMAAQCHGGGPGCAEQPLIPPPAVGLPHFDAPPPPVFGALVAVRPAPPAHLREAPPPALERPPLSVLAV